MPADAPSAPGDPSPSARSLRGLDGLNFLMADVRDGLGPYLSVFLKGGQHWQPGAIGVAMAASSVAAAVCQIPAGLLVDRLRAKRLLVAASGVGVSAGCLLIVLRPKFASVVAAQALIGAASAIIPPAIAALSLGLVGRGRFDARVSRNEGLTTGATSPPPCWSARWGSGTATSTSSTSCAPSPPPARSRSASSIRRRLTTRLRGAAGTAGGSPRRRCLGANCSGGATCGFTWRRWRFSTSATPPCCRWPGRCSPRRTPARTPWP